MAFYFAGCTLDELIFQHLFARVKTVDEARALIETGLEHVCNYEGVMLFRKRK